MPYRAASLDTPNQPSLRSASGPPPRRVVCFVNRHRLITISSLVSSLVSSPVVAGHTHTLAHTRTHSHTRTPHRQERRTQPIGPAERDAARCVELGGRLHNAGKIGREWFALAMHLAAQARRGKPLPPAGVYSCAWSWFLFRSAGSTTLPRGSFKRTLWCP